MLFQAFIKLHLADSLLSLLLITYLSPLSDFIMNLAIWKGLDFLLQLGGKKKRKKNRYFLFLNPLHNPGSLFWSVHGIDLYIHGLVNSCCVLVQLFGFPQP